jgi:hypothetical protein
MANALRLPVSVPLITESAALGAALQACGHVEAVARRRLRQSQEGQGDCSDDVDFDLSAWITEHHDPPVVGGGVVLPSADPGVVAAYDRAFALYEARAGRLFAGGES